MKWAKTMNTHTLPLVKNAGHIALQVGVSGREASPDKVSAPSTYTTKTGFSRLPHKGKGKSIRAQYGLSLQLGVMLSLLVLIVLFKVPLHVNSSFENEVFVQEVVQLEEIVQTDQKMKAPPPPRAHSAN